VSKLKNSFYKIKIYILEDTPARIAAVEAHTAATLLTQRNKLESLTARMARHIDQAEGQPQNN
jgi:hypothetical protein